MAHTRQIFGFLLALPLLVLAACDSGNSAGGPLKGGMATTPGGTTNPGTTPATGNPILGIWGARQGTGGEVWEFYADGTFQLNSYVLQDNTLYREITFGGTFTAANGTLSMTVKTTTCAEVRAGARSVSYAVAGTTLTVTLPGMAPFAYTKDNAPNPTAQAQVLGCFIGQDGSFMAREVMNAVP